LKLSIPLILILFSSLSFVLASPEIFSDGFESNDFSEWTGTSESAGESSDVVNTDPHHGTYHASFTTDGSSSNEYAYCYKTFGSSYAEIYARAYIKLKTAELEHRIMEFSAGGSWHTMMLITATRVYLYYHSGATHSSIFSETDLDLDTWYCFELYAKVHATAGQSKLYLNDVELLATASDLDTDEHGDVDQYRLGTYSSASATAHGIYVDCVIVDTSYIGMEAVGQDLQFDLAEYVNISTSLDSSKEMLFSQSGYVNLSETSTFNKEVGFYPTAYVNLSESMNKGMDLAFAFSQFVNFTSSITFTPQLYAGIDMIVSLFETVAINSIVDMNLEVKFEITEIMEETLAINAQMYPTLPTVAEEVRDALIYAAIGIATVALILAITSGKQT